MKSLKTLASLIVLAFFVGIAPAFAAEVTLSLSDKGGGVVDVVVNDSSNVLGVAFTVNYDTTKLTDPVVDSNYFDQFISNDIPASGMLKLAGAKAESTSTGQATIFTITFTIAGGATGTTNVSIVPTTLNDTAAGYSSSGEQTSVVVGDTVLLSATDLNSAPVSANLNTGSGTAFNLDVDGNGIMEGSYDGILLYRYLNRWHLTNNATWTRFAIGPGGKTKAEIEATLNAAELAGQLDVDGNGIMEGSYDGILLYRYLNRWHLTNNATWTRFAIGPGGISKTEIEDYLSNLEPK